jgi:hypothetical protein
MSTTKDWRTIRFTSSFRTYQGSFVYTAQHSKNSLRMCELGLETYPRYPRRMETG